MKLVHQILVICAVASAHPAAMAGTKIVGRGATPELACWDHDYRANEHARDKTTCYTSCKPKQLQFDGTSYVFRSTAPNQQGSCKKAKYDRSYIGRKQFLAKFPPPGSEPKQPPAQQADITPKRGINEASWQPGVPNSERARLTISNRSSDRGITFYRVSVRDSRYSFPARVIEQGEVILEPNTSWTREFHQWGATEWHADTE